MAEFTVGSLVRDGSDNTDQGGMYPHKSAGSKAFAHDLMTLHNLWLAPTQMLQLAPGMCWCSCCGDVRPNSYFDPAIFNADGTVATYAKWCKSCTNAHDPKLRTMKYCSACKMEHPRNDFADDDGYTDGKYPSCYASEARRKAAKRARDAWVNEGRVLRSWQSVRQSAR